MESKEALDYLREHTRFYEPVNREAFRTIEKDLEAANLIRTKAANNNFFKGCLLRMFCDEERGKPHFWSRQTIRDENYELIKAWIERSDKE